MLVVQVFIQPQKVKFACVKLLKHLKNGRPFQNTGIAFVRHIFKRKYVDVLLAAVFSALFFWATLLLLLAFFLLYSSVVYVPNSRVGIFERL